MLSSGKERKNMEKYETPVMEVEELEEDIIMASMTLR